MIPRPELTNKKNKSDVPSGWKKEIKQRKSGKTAGKFDIYIYSPDKKVFRSKKSLQLYLEQTLSPLKITDFNFCLQDDKESFSAENQVEFEAAEDEKKEVRDRNKDVLIPEDNYSNTLKYQEATEVPSTIPILGDELKLKQCSQENVISNTPEGIDYRRKACKKSPYFRSRKRQTHESIPNYFRTLSKWDPPRSPYNLIQEDLYHDPWKMLVATICLQKTTGKAVKKVISKFFDSFPSPQALLKSQSSEIMNLLQPLGLQEKKSKILLRFSEEYLNKQWKYPIELHGIGKYGNDSYRIFCVNEWKHVQPKDHMLEKYYKWLINHSCQS